MKIGHETRVLLLALAGGLPAVATVVILLALEGRLLRTQITVDALVIILWLSCCFAARGRIAGPLRTLANLLEALREGRLQYSCSGR